MADRKAELERMRARLEEVRKEKQRRQQERERQEVLTNNMSLTFFLTLTCHINIRWKTIIEFLEKVIRMSQWMIF
jgi:hypothetical protein